MNTKDIGNISEAKILAACVEQGWTVLLPFGENEPYDLVIERGRGFERLQVKTGKVYGAESRVIKFNACSVNLRKGVYVRTDYGEKADLFAVYVPPPDEATYLVPVRYVGKREGRLRLDPTLNGQATSLDASHFVLNGK